MESVELINNPYTQRLQILINGESVSVYSNLEKYMDEPFTYWCDRILQTIYEECNYGDFRLHFSSREEELEIMEKIASEFPHCVQFSSSPIIRSTPLIKRISGLNSIIKNVRRSGYHVFQKDILFILPESLREFYSDLNELDVKNSFCSIIPHAVYYKDYSVKRPSGDIVVLLADGDNINDISNRLNVDCDFGIVVSGRKAFITKKKQMFIYETTKDSLFDTIFQCLLLSPLLEMFISCISSLSPEIYEQYAEQIEELQSTSYKIIPVLEKNTIELGKSIRIDFKTDIDGYSVKGTDLNFSYSNKGVIYCNGMIVEGLKQGKATLNIFKQGENNPCGKVDFTVIKRNRISEIKLEDTSLILGEGDHVKLRYSYLPPDADNVDSIEWSSDNESVVKVDKYGSLHAVGLGTCTIRCYAEQICARCDCCVKRHLKTISVESNEINMLYGSSKELKVRQSPQNCMDDQLNFISMDMQIVNIVGRTAKAVGCGTCRVIIQNKQETVRTEMLIHVLTEYEMNQLQRQLEGKPEKKKGFLAKLFKL